MSSARHQAETQRRSFAGAFVPCGPIPGRGSVAHSRDQTGGAGGAIGIAVLGSVLSTSYSANLSGATAGSGLPAEGARRMADAVGSSFADAVAQTSLAGAVILGVGTVLVAVLPPGTGRGTRDAAEHEVETEAELSGASR